jgi:hypothetical protein
MEFSNESFPRISNYIDENGKEVKFDNTIIPRISNEDIDAEFDKRFGVNSDVYKEIKERQSIIRQQGKPQQTL